MPKASPSSVVLPGAWLRAGRIGGWGLGVGGIHADFLQEAVSLSRPRVWRGLH